MKIDYDLLVKYCFEVDELYKTSDVDVAWPDLYTGSYITIHFSGLPNYRPVYIPFSYKTIKIKLI